MKWQDDKTIQDVWNFCPDETETKQQLDSAQVQSGQVRRTEGTHVQTAVVLMGLADVGCHHPVRIMETAGANAAIVHLRHQTVARNELHQNVLTEELWRIRRRWETDGEKEEAGQTSNQLVALL